MIEVRNIRCGNPDCMVYSFNYATCESPICPACHVCADCGRDESEHGQECEQSCDECQNSTDCQLMSLSKSSNYGKENDYDFYCGEFERKAIRWSERG